ncbi:MULTISPECIES: efflux RND transporter periplasmic adaptor subunit [Aequorivita]|uniref:Efflux RND transporter periplasmic adaptor subunit n=1 Tax=Aequorivita iocasae TaxID=2803865 RepID=A0ABX7DSG2_9FLAO|nr:MULTISPECIES: efflux RND transporter periplasmic adaptor subunit [Aequorivita]QQX77023.1 efflux RND transporter periplasmic adaptor subunit [Aequorivita iocasae]UCA56502.1 efflux RND transporter periplasmic adaptor subunit [Aequorivita sp. F7]
MKKYIIYIAILALGLVLGYVFFGTSLEGSSNTKNISEKDRNHESETQMWTCSMHPQILQPEPGDCPICGMELIPATSDGDGLGLHQIKLSKNAMALANIQTTVVGGSEGADGTLKLSGKIQENQEGNVIQASYFSGRIEKLDVNFTGEKVKRGQLLATIYAPELVAAQQELITAASLKESQPNLYQAVRNKLKLWKLSEKQINAIEASGKVRENFPVYATVSGTVSEKLVNEGDYVKQGQPLLKIADLNSVWAMFDAYENQLSSLQVGQEIKVTTNAYPNKEFHAKISFIEPTLTTTTRTVNVRAELNNENGILKPGMFVEGIITDAAPSNNNKISIPKTAVLWTGKRSVVYVKSNPEEPIFEMREVSLGATMNDSYEIISGLRPGEEVVTNGTFTVDAAAQLQGKTSMMNHQGPLEKKKASGTLKTVQMKMELPENFQKDFLPVIDSYITLKEAFVTSNFKVVKPKAEAMLHQLKSIKTEGLHKMEKGHLFKIKDMLVAITESADIENQRDHFIILSENMVAITNNIKMLPKAIYVAECPMANSNRGAVWLSHSPEIHNPYYGDAMLNCGSVIDTIK